MTESQKWAAFDIAEIRLDLMISHFDDLISHAQQRSICTAEQIARWQLEHDKLVQAKAVLTLNDLATKMAPNIWLDLVGSHGGPATPTADRALR